LIEVLQNERFANLANLRSELTAVENAALMSQQDFGFKQARETVLATVVQCRRTRFKLGHALSNYRRCFKAEQSWMPAVKAIAGAISCSERTVHRIISDYELAAELPAMTLDAMFDLEIDPAAGKNAPLVEELSRIPEPETHEEAAKAVTNAHQQHVARKKQAKRTGQKAERATLEEFTTRTVKQFEAQFRSVPPLIRDGQIRYVFEHIVNSLRSNVREVRQFSRPSLVPKPEVKEAA
jgi:hypothetical protein